MPLNISVIDEKKVYLRKATNDDMELLFKWVNEAECRKNSFNSKEITIEEHENWFNDVIKKDNCKIFIASLYGVDVGQVRIEMEGENMEISYMVALEYRGNGYGKEILNLAEIWLKNNVSKDFKMIGKVKKNNIASVKCFESCGYDMSVKEEYFYFMKKVYVGENYK
ncbi:MAG: GNAT family N-acetyltransferase [Lachnospiraceae bacterium]|nr:GNAT family N-acetyltransferase [Lachnospiraceae bacterium]